MNVHRQEHEKMMYFIYTKFSGMNKKSTPIGKKNLNNIVNS